MFVGFLSCLFLNDKYRESQNVNAVPSLELLIKSVQYLSSKDGLEIQHMDKTQMFAEDLHPI